MIIAIPDDYHRVVPTLDCFARLAAHDVRVFSDASPPFDRMVENLRDAEIIVPIRERTTFTRELIEALPRLRLFSQTGRSFHHIDRHACRERGVAIATGSHASPETVAEQTWALIFATARRIPQETQLMKSGEWRPDFNLGLHGRTLGVFGLGTIGQLVAKAGGAFGMDVLVWGQEKSRESAQRAGYRFASSQRALFAEADVVALCVRLSDATRGIVSRDDLAAMKPHGILINTARADLVAPGVLEAALDSGRPGYAGVDVYHDEPVLGGDHPLLRRANAVCTAHSAWLEQRTYELYFGEAFDNALAFAEGRPGKLAAL